MKKKTDGQNNIIKVLVAEDNSAVREFIVRAIQSMDGFHLTSVNDGQEALNRLTESKFDILITDIVMPNIDGITLALKAMREYEDLRIIMISGYVQERMRAHNLDALVNRIIAKPFSLEEICEAVQDVLEQPKANA